MSFFNDFKTEIKLLVIVAGISGILALGAILLIKNLYPAVDEGKSVIKSFEICSAGDIFLSPKEACQANLEYNALEDCTVILAEGLSGRQCHTGIKCTVRCPEEITEDDVLNTNEDEFLEPFETWQTYRNDEYGFEFRHPAFLQREKVITESSSFELLKYCDGEIVESFGDDVGEVCEGIRYQIEITVYDVPYSLESVKQYYDAPPVLADGTSAIQEYEIGGRLFAIGRHEVYTYSGWATHTALGDKTAAVSFSGNAYVSSLHSNELTSEEFQKIRQILSTFRFVDPASSSMEIEGYKFEELQKDLNGNGKPETIRIYTEDREDLGSKPVIVKIFSDDQNPVEKFSYTGTGNVVWGVDVFSNFWGDGATAIMVNESNYAGGSGSTALPHFFTYRYGKYEVIEGPVVGGHNWKCCKITNEGTVSQVIIAAESKWAEDFSDYCAGCSSRMQFFVYTWNGEGYDKVEVGVTENKYLNETIDEILEQEPDVLKFS